MTRQPDPTERFRLARERLRALRAQAAITEQRAQVAEPPAPAPAPRRRPVWRGWPVDGPPGLREAHVELSALQVVRRMELLIALGGPDDSLYADPDITTPDELAAARLLLWTASGWMATDAVLDLVAVAAISRGWSDVPASDLFTDLLGEPDPGPTNDDP